MCAEEFKARLDWIQLENRFAVEQLKKELSAAQSEVKAVKHELHMQKLEHHNVISEANEQLSIVSDRVIAAHDRVASQALRAQAELVTLRQELAVERSLKESAIEHFDGLSSAHNQLAADRQAISIQLADSQKLLASKIQELTDYKAVQKRRLEQVLQVKEYAEELKVKYDESVEEISSLRQALQDTQSQLSAPAPSDPSTFTPELQVLHEKWDAEKCEKEVWIARYVDLKNGSEIKHVKELDKVVIRLGDYEYHNLHFIYEREKLRKQIDGLVDERDELLDERDEMMLYLKQYIDKFGMFGEGDDEEEEGSEEESPPTSPISPSKYKSSPLVRSPSPTSDSPSEPESPTSPSASPTDTDSNSNSDSDSEPAPVKSLSIIRTQRKMKVSNRDELRKSVLIGAHTASFKVPDDSDLDFS